MEIKGYGVDGVLEFSSAMQCTELIFCMRVTGLKFERDYYATLWHGIERNILLHITYCMLLKRVYLKDNKYYILLTTYYSLKTTGYKLLTTNYLLPTAYWLQLTTYYLLHTFTTYYIIHATYYIRLTFTNYYILLTI